MDKKLLTILLTVGVIITTVSSVEARRIRGIKNRTNITKGELSNFLNNKKVLEKFGKIKDKTGEFILSRLEKLRAKEEFSMNEVCFLTASLKKEAQELGYTGIKEKNS